MIGVVELDEARRRAYDAGLDLVEVAADSKPPVVRIMDFGRFKYEQSKKDKASKAKSKVSELKEVRMGRSLKIDPHDIEIRLQQARRFLLEGHKVQIVQNFRGREIAHRERGHDRMKSILAALEDIGRLEVAPRLNGRRMNMIIAPDKAKVDQFRKQKEAAAAEKSGKKKSKDPAPPKNSGPPKDSAPPIDAAATTADKAAETPTPEPVQAQPASDQS